MIIQKPAHEAHLMDLQGTLKPDICQDCQRIIAETPLFKEIEDIKHRLDLLEREKK